MNYLEKLDKIEELSSEWDKSVDALCEVFPAAFESNLVISGEKVIDVLLKEYFGDFVDIVYDWRFEHEFGLKSPMVFYIDGVETLARDNSELAKILESLKEE